MLHEGITKSLILKEGNKADFNYSRPIIFLTSSYKIFAKAFQLRFQTILRDIINPKQNAFLQLRFILDNIVLTQNALHWV